MNKTILFDLDGTLTDSGEGIINCAILALEHFGLPIPSREEMRVFVGPPLLDSFIRHGVPAHRAEEAVAVYRSRYIPIGKYENAPYPGIRELLEHLKAQGHRLFVATSKPEAMSVDILEHFDLAKYFDGICGASLDASRSTKDAVIAYLMEQHGKDGDMVMVGDTKFDILGAKAHGIPAIGVAWGYGEVEDMKNAGAAAIAYSMEELEQFLTKMSEKEELVKLRQYQTKDLKEITELFYNTVHTVNAKDYSRQQLDVWATGEVDLERWNTSLLAHDSVVAVKDGIIVGFGDMDESGYLDRLYVHADFQRQGIAAAICDRLEGACQGKNFSTHASITARPFFEKRGYRVVKEQQVERGGILLTNFVMEKMA